MRLAHANCLKAQTLADYTFGRYSAFWARDQDKLASPLVIERLALLTGREPRDVYTLTLADYEGKLYAYHNPYGHTRWILPLGIYHRTRRRYGLQYCPVCLWQDPEPYYRRSWRLALSTVCERHGVLMHDRCHQCGAPVAFFRNDLGHPTRHSFHNFARCDNCGADLSRAPAYDPPAPDGQSLAMLRSIISLHDIGWWFTDTEALGYGHLYFDVLHHLASLLASGVGLKLLREVERRIGRKPLGDIKLAPMVFELRTFEERHWLVLMALWLLQDWPERLVQTCRAAKMWQSWLLRIKEGPLPWWFEHVVLERLDRSIYHPCVEEAAHAAEHLRSTGVAVSRTSVGALLGGRDFQAAGSYAAARRSPWPQSEGDFERLLNALDRRIQSLEAGSIRRLLAERDRLIILMMRTMKWGPARALRTSLSEAEAMLNPAQSPLPLAFRWSLLRYLHSIRPALAGGEQRAALFIGSKEDGIGIENLAHRIRSAYSHFLKVNRPGN